MMPGGLITASTHISMILITIVLLLVMLMALFGVTGKGGIIPSSSEIKTHRNNGGRGLSSFGDIATFINSQISPSDHGHQKI